VIAGKNSDVDRRSPASAFRIAPHLYGGNDAGSFRVTGPSRYQYPVYHCIVVPNRREAVLQKLWPVSDLFHQFHDVSASK
jgi:hypothetical protein